MGLFGKNIKDILKEFRNKREDYNEDLGREIESSFEDLRNEYEETQEVVPEFDQLVSELQTKLDSHDIKKLEAFKAKIKRINHTARNGVEAMRELSRNQRKLSTEAQWLYDEFEG